MTQVYEAPSDLALIEARPLTSATGVMPIVTPEEARAQMLAYTALVAAVIGEEDYQTFTERGKTKKFKKKSAVKKLQTYFGFTVEIIGDAVRDDLGEGHFGFRVKARATSPNGRFVEALAGCATHEERFDLTPNDYETGEDDPKFLRRQRKVLARAYHDVLSTAETRATNRAAMNLIGAGEVTAEEVQRSRDDAPPSRPAAGRRSQATPIPTNEQTKALVDLAASLNIPSLRAWIVANIAPDFEARERKVLTLEEHGRAMDLLDAFAPPVAPEPAKVAPAPAPRPAGPPQPSKPPKTPAAPPEDGRMHARTQGRLFALLDERLSTEKAARLIFAAEHGIVVDSFSQVTELQARALIRQLELLKPLAAIDDPDDLIAAAHERGLLL
jgi:hypothetical protein